METKKEEKPVEQKSKVRCPKCNSTFCYIRLKDKTLVCRSCGNVDSEVVI